MEPFNGVLYVSHSGKIKTYAWKDKEGNVIKQPKVSVADFSFVMEILKQTTGKILTVVEASYSDKEQRKAMKDIVKGIFSDEMDAVTDALFNEEKRKEWNDMANESAQNMTEEELENCSVDTEDIIFDRI